MYYEFVKISATLCKNETVSLAYPREFFKTKRIFLKSFLQIPIYFYTFLITQNTTSCADPLNIDQLYKLRLTPVYTENRGSQIANLHLQSP